MIVLSETDKERILKYVDEHPSGVTVSQIMTYVSINRSRAGTAAVVRDHMDDLVRTKVLRSWVGPVSARSCQECTLYARRVPE